MKKVIYAIMTFAPVLTLAAFDAGGNLQGVVDFIKKTVGNLIPIVFGIVIIYFFWGLAKYVQSAGDPKKAAEGKSIMIYGVIAITIMTTIYGLASWLGGLFGIGGTTGTFVPLVSGLPTP